MGRLDMMCILQGPEEIDFLLHHVPNTGFLRAHQRSNNETLTVKLVTAAKVIAAAIAVHFTVGTKLNKRRVLSFKAPF